MLSLSDGTSGGRRPHRQPAGRQEVARSGARQISTHADTPRSRADPRRGRHAELTCGPSWPGPCGPGPCWPSLLGGCLLDDGLSGHGLGGGLLHGGLLDGGLLGGSLLNGLLGGNRLAAFLPAAFLRRPSWRQPFCGLLAGGLLRRPSSTAAFLNSLLHHGLPDGLLRRGRPPLQPRFTAGPSAGRRCAPETTALN